ncbi:MAG: hypothetical protein BZ151_12730 [Desulfobacca sp. 4484_104]|nr:MAG: hypothetical protein BZ151_12730 [Desulfobacca sp. 4484_104]
MKGLWQQLRVPENRRRFLLSLAVVLLLLVVARFLLGIYVQRNQELDQKISLLELQYEKSMRIIRSGKKIRARHEALKRYRRKLIADRFIWDETPSLAEARLQRLLKDMAAKSKIDVKTVKILPHVTLDGSFFPAVGNQIHQSSGSAFLLPEFRAGGGDQDAGIMKHLAYRQLISLLLLLLGSLVLLLDRQAYKRHSRVDFGCLAASAAVRDEKGAALVKELEARLRKPRVDKARCQVIVDRNILARRKDVVLYGTVVVGEHRRAMLEFRRFSRKNKRQLLTEGDVAVDGDIKRKKSYELLEIREKEVVLKDVNGTVFTVGLYEGKKQWPKKTANRGSFSVSRSANDGKPSLTVKRAKETSPADRETGKGDFPGVGAPGGKSQAGQKNGRNHKHSFWQRHPAATLRRRK